MYLPHVENGHRFFERQLLRTAYVIAPRAPLDITKVFMYRPEYYFGAPFCRFAHALMRGPMEARWGGRSANASCSAPSPRSSTAVCFEWPRMARSRRTRSGQWPRMSLLTGAQVWLRTGSATILALLEQITIDNGHDLAASCADAHRAGVQQPRALAAAGYINFGFNVINRVADGVGVTLPQSQI